MSDLVGASHEFHDPDYARRWSDGFKPTPARMQLFDTIVTALNAQGCQKGRVVELGSGPGYLANHLLKALPDITYECVDFSQAMLNIAMSGLQNFSGRIRFTQADLLKPHWESALHAPADAVVSTWALHDLGSEASIAEVYRACKSALRPNGVLLNGDFIKPDRATHPYEAGRLTISRHLELLKGFGYCEVECLAVFEQELIHPSAAQNYACVQALA